MSFLKGWVSNQYKTGDEREKSTEYKHKMNADSDTRIEKTLKKMGIKFTWKSTCSFQIHLKNRNVMLYTGKYEMIYDQKNNKKYYTAPWHDDFLDIVKKLENDSQ